MRRLVSAEQCSNGKGGVEMYTNPFTICSFIIRGFNEIDINSGKVTPVPIPNTAVKLIRVDGIGTQFGAERVDRCRSH